MIDLIGDISQTWHLDDPRFTLSFASQGQVFEGKYGCSCWWIPLSSEIGLKIYNWYKCETYATAVDKLDHIQVLLDTLIDRAVSSKKYLPKVYGGILIRHTGKWTSGGRVLKQGDNDKVFYPAFLMKRYGMPNEVPPEVLDAIRDSFESDQILLHKDTFRAAQIGESAGQYVVLDVADIHQRKFL